MAACSMTWATVCGSAIMDRCPALTSVMWAPARLAMKVSSAGGITRSAVPITAHDGMVLQAGAPDGSVKALAARGRWVAAMTAAWLRAQPGGKAAGDHARLDVEIHVAGGRAGVGHRVEDLGRVSQQA